MHILRSLWFGAQLVGAVVVTVALLWLGAQWLWALRLMNVQTGSMVPTFGAGDALIMQRLRPDQISELRPGIIVSYKSARNPNNLVTHRLVQVNAQGFQTKGDAAMVPDPPVRSDLLAGKVVAVLPGMGKALGWLTGRPGLIACVYVPAALMAVGELVRLERSYAWHRLYRLGEA